jgi:dihydrofolate synthase / folylpolyglutamate synthase
VSYADALNRLLSSPTRPKLGLDRMRALCGALGDPQRKLTAIHVAGTKGKGSTCAMIAAIARAQNLKVGLTTSPHLSCARERIVVDGEMITEAEFVSLEEQVHRAAQKLDDAPTFFEQMIAMAFVHFANVKVDLAVIEVGLGGRLDATNVIKPRLSVITKLGMDHMEHLGPTLEDIAREKAGIIKKGVPAISAPQEETARRVLVEVGGTQLTFINDRQPTSLRGAHQQENAGIAYAAMRAVFATPPDVARRGLLNVYWPGRYETVSTEPLIILDGAHNETSAFALAETIRADERVKGKNITLVVGMTSGRDPEAFARGLASIRPTKVHAVAHRSPRAQDVADVGRGLRKVFGDVVEGTLDDALAAPGPVVVTGSLYVVGEARGYFVPGPVDPAFPLF